MKKALISSLKVSLLSAIAITLSVCGVAQRIASVKVNQNIRHQVITGFGGFVNSPQFGYNHMTEAEIRKMWGANSEAGYNIMRIYLPIGENNWPQSLSTAQLAKSLGIKVFASPWSMPTHWKTVDIVGSQYVDNGVVKDVYLKEEHYADYANYLNNYLTYLRNNGVELDGISVQNEPDYRVDYAGCIFTPAQMAKFIREYGHLVNGKLIAAEGVGITDNYVNALIQPDVLPNLGIFAGHQYGAIQSGLKNMQTKGKEVWMTEYLINWNADENTSRNVSWSRDAFNFANKLNDAMLANVNAWIHYATKRYYSLMGDGLFGSTTGAITKRGRFLSHYAKYVTGATRVEGTWNDNAGSLTGSSYLSVTGDSVIVQVINPSNSSYTLSVDLPFLTTAGKSITTTETQDMVEAAVSIAAETSRPKANISASSVTTLVFTKSGDYTPSQMTGNIVNYDKIENQTPTSAAFGTGYQLSNKTVTFKVDVPLISNNTNNSNGYLQLAHTFNKLVFRVESITSAGSYTSANTTLYYINDAGAVRSHNYGTVTFDKRNNFDWVLDISKQVLTDGCKGIIGLRNGNYTSILTLKLANVYFAVGSEKGYAFNGVYSSNDSYLLDAIEDPAFTMLNFTSATGIAPQTDWHAAASNKNCVYFVQGAGLANKINVVDGTNCARLELTSGAGNFFSPNDFTATAAVYRCNLNGFKMLVLPFNASIPAGVKAYQLEYTDPEVVGQLITGGAIAANTPVLVTGTGSFTFEGAGAVSSPRVVTSGIANGTYIGVTVPAGFYQLATINGQPAFSRTTTGSLPTLQAFDGYLALPAGVTAANVSLRLNEGNLPVVLGHFTARPQGQAVQLKWTTLTETNNTGFWIERSANGTVFQKVAFVEGNLNSSTQHEYTFTDAQPLAGKSYYRLRQMDADGAYRLSGVEQVFFGKVQPALSLYPNPATRVLNITYSGSTAGKTIVLYNATGSEVLRARVQPAGTTQIDISALAAGTYFYNFNNLKGSFVKQ